MVMINQAEKGVICPVDGTFPHGPCAYTEILEHLDLGIIVLDTINEEVIFHNMASKTMLEGSDEPMDYNSISTLLLQDMGKGFVSDGFDKTQALHYKNKLLGYNAYFISHGFIVVFIRDITESARLESIAEAVNAMENITYIFSGIRHELGNPINSIKMTLSVLKKNLGRYSRDTVHQYVDRTLAEITRVEYLLKSLKSFSMFENPSIQNIDLSEFMDLFQALVGKDLEKNGITIEVILSLNAQWVHVDPRALQQVMLNLIANAADSLEGRENPTISITTQKKNNVIWLCVEDNGVGIPAEDQKNLFKPFYTTKPNGTGLGLVIAKKMLAKMNSRIGIESRKEVGTKVTISIPEGRRKDA
jgi:signal transduction histidine kinase